MLLVRTREAGKKCLHKSIHSTILSFYRSISHRPLWLRYFVCCSAKIQLFWNTLTSRVLYIHNNQVPSMNDKLLTWTIAHDTNLNYKWNNSMIRPCTYKEMIQHSGGHIFWYIVLVSICCHGLLGSISFDNCLVVCVLEFRNPSDMICVQVSNLTKLWEISTACVYTIRIVYHCPLGLVL